jgi:uncharacterized protein (TIGR03067 family)
MRSLAVWLVAAAGLALVAASPGGDDAKKFQGTWEVVEFEIQGKARPAEDLKKVKAVFSGDKFKFETGQSDIKESTFTIDPAKKPKQIDIATDETGGKLELRGIYEFKGDNLTICLFAAPAERPSEFKTNPDMKSVRFLLKRAK